MKKQLLIPAFLTILLGGGAALAADTKNPPIAASTDNIEATGTVKSVDAVTSKAVITHDPIAALSWPTMTMDFALADKALVSKIKAGDKVKFTLTPVGKGNYAITAIETAR